MSIARAFRIIGLPLLIGTAGHAQTLVRPLTSVRLTIDKQVTSVRLLGADSASLLVETPWGERRAIARSGVTSIERRGGHAKKGAVVLGSVSAVVGAAFAGLLSQGFCETTDCSDNLVPSIVGGGIIFGGIGAVGGAVIGHLAGGWRPMDHEVGVRAMSPIAVCLTHPRFEGRYTSGRPGASRRMLFNIGATCASGMVVGVEGGELGDIYSDVRRESVDAQYGTVVTQRFIVEHSYYRGAFLERPLTAGRMRLSGIVGYGQYVDDSWWSESSYMKTFDPNADHQAFLLAHPYANGRTDTRELGATLGGKVSIPIGTLASTGVTIRLQRPGTAKQQLETGIALAFRP
jgi:hypothetical protein